MHMWINSVVGLVVGITVGATGVGGGALMAPLLILFLGVTPHTAVGTDLLYAFLTKSVGVGVHHSENRVDWQIVKRLALGSLPAVVATLAWLHYAQQGEIREGVIIFALGIVLIITAVLMVCKPMLFGLAKHIRIADPTDFHKFQPVLTVISGAILGFLVAMTSIGAGALGTVLLVSLYPLRMTSGKLVGTGLAHAIPLTLVAGAGHILLGNVDFVLLFWLLLGSIPGVLVGSHLAGKLPDRVLQIVIAVVLGAIGLKMLG